MRNDQCDVVMQALCGSCVFFDPRNTRDPSGAFANTQSIKKPNEAFPKQTTWLRLRRGDDEVWALCVRKSRVNVCQGCVFKDAVCMVLRRAPPPAGGLFGHVLANAAVPGDHPLAEHTSRRAEPRFAPGSHVAVLPWSCISCVSTEKFSSFSYCSLLQDVFEPHKRGISHWIQFCF